MPLPASDYADLLRSLAPTGPAWPVDEPDTLYYKLFEGLGLEFARVDNRSADLVNEADPRTTNELLGDWERVLGLPEACMAGQVQTTVERRNAVVAKLRAQGGQTPQYFIDVAAALGFTITITEFREFVAGSPAGAPDCDASWLFWWQVNAPLNSIRYFEAGRSVAGDPLASWGNTQLECVINHLKPAHTRVLFSYS